MRASVVLASAVLFVVSAFAASPSGSPAATALAAPNQCHSYLKTSGHQSGADAVMCTLDGKHQASHQLRRVAAADSCTACNDQGNGCCEEVCARDSDAACYILVCCSGKACYKKSCM